MNYVLSSLATANPKLYVTQQQALADLERLFTLEERERALYRKILLSGKIRGRHFAMATTDDATENDQDRLVERFRDQGRLLAHDAAQKALERAGVRAGEIGGILINTCTGYLCPGFTSYLSESLGLAADVRPLDIVGMGCGGAIPNLDAAVNLLRARPERPVLSVAVEICTATLFMDPDPGVIISNAIFADGAAAAVLRATDGAQPGGILRFIDFESVLLPAHRANLQYRTEKHRLRNVLTREVPVIGAHAVTDVAGRLLAKHGLAQNDIAHWIVHPGGTEVLDQIAKKMGLQHEQLGHSYRVFEEHGNMSSTSVLFVLDRLLRSAAPPRAGEKGLLLSFGAGFTAFAGLVEFGEAGHEK